MGHKRRRELSPDALELETANAKTDETFIKDYLTST